MCYEGNNFLVVCNTWQVLDSDYRRKKKMAGRHIAISTWLEALSMPEYLPLFHQYGGVEDLIYATESEIKDLGIRIGAHRAKILSSLRILREKYEKGRVTGSGLFSLQRTDSVPSASAPTSPTGPYPDFQHLIISPEKLQLDLQKELAGDPSDLRSRPWYHGSITRQHAETLVCENGDFIVRDCISKPGDFVLTCRWKGTPLSFMINSIVGNCAPGQLPVISYQFEDDAFATIQELIQYYQHRGKPVTQVSGALLKNPISRSMPLSYYDTKYGALNNSSSGTYATPDQSPKPSPFVTPSGSPSSSPEMHRHGRWAGSQPILSLPDNDDAKHSSRNRESRSSSLDRCDSLPVINVTPPGELLEKKAPPQVTLPQPTINHTRSGSAPALVDDVPNNFTKKFSSLGRRKLVPASSESELSSPPPPKPSRIPSVKYKQKPTVHIRTKVEEEDDRDYSDYFQVKEQPSWLQNTSSSSPSAEEVSLRHLSPEDHVNDQSRRVKREKVFYPANPLDQLSPNTKQSFSNSFSSGQSEDPSGGQRIVSRVVPTTSETLTAPSASKTSQIVARSRSFRYVNQNDNSRSSKAYLTLPAKSSRKNNSRVNVNSQNLNKNIDKGDNDYDVPKEHAIDNDWMGAQYIEYLRCRKLILPPKACLSAIVPENFQTDLLPKGHRVLDPNVLQNVKTLLLNKTPRTIAMHLTKYDIALVSAANEKDLGLGIFSGLELLTLPQGKQLRQDIIERWECLRLFTMVSLLTIPTVNERAKMLSLWIQTCLDLKLAAGNLFSFSAIMSALTGSQINRLTDTWLVLRQNHTASAYNFDTKLRPAYKALNDGSSDLPLNNETIPYITPLCLLLERDLDTVLLDYYWEVGLDPIGSAIDVLYTHLDTARVIASQGDLYRTTSSSLVANLNYDPELGQALSPEFHLMAMWGGKGCGAKRKDRVDKLEQILTLFSHKLQIPGDDGTEV
ncbi:SH2 domain-containing protein 3C-like isoform X2 [Biomphalaria glabrata]|uniref:SH2 domain-containing protein 3C-like isoform X2 n=1 Tax=Biomphalaria glabrata TaxID=6526 RepID=A0A9W3BE95_BIOGL|nr:SH2 domain-containing protein 3C-like isoform X2 [Biomphalaria glabrata]